MLSNLDATTTSVKKAIFTAFSLLENDVQGLKIDHLSLKQYKS